MKKISKDLIKLYLKRRTTDKKLAYLLGILNTYCDLTDKGVRDVSLFAPYWTSNRHRQYSPIIKNIVQIYDLQVMHCHDLTDKE